MKINPWGIDFITDFDSQFIPSVVFFAAVFAAFITALLFLMLSLIRKLKARRFVNNILIFKAFYAVYQAMNYLYKKLFYGDIQGVTLTRALYYRQLILVIPSAVLIPAAAVLFAAKSSLFLLPAALEILLVFWYAKGNSRIYMDIDNNIQVSVNEMMKSERMKIALVTNVSHDLKTPLTSIISYIDLLSKEELSETAEDYVKVLQAKADRLKNIVTDLFDLAKSTSGDIAMEYDVIDLKKLMEQTLAEMGDQIEASSQTIKTKFPDTQVNIKTDGKKLYRVFQNVIDNALKYSMKGTRVYIDLEMAGKQAVATVKNTASYEMNFTEEEILQRFTRGDQARTQEGSGLGLSIAESFTKVCGGNFEVKLDGDQFKVIITFHIIEE
jgi:signal transduction histidine kinase